MPGLAHAFRRLCLVTSLLAVSQAAWAADPMSGKWELNVRASMYDSGTPPKSMQHTQVIDGDTITATSEIVEADGASRTEQFAAKLDGKDHPLTGAPNADTISFKRLDATTLAYTLRKGGKTTATGKYQVAEDGSELTISHKDEKGEEFSNLMVFDRR